MTTSTQLINTFGFIEVFEQTVETEGDKKVKIPCPKFSSLTEVIEFYGGEDRLLLQINRQLKTDIINKVRPKLRKGKNRATILSEVLGYEAVTVEPDEENGLESAVTFHVYRKVAIGNRLVDPVEKEIRSEIEALMKEYKTCTPERALEILTAMGELNTKLQAHRTRHSG